MSIRFCTFNVNNLFVRYRFGEAFPGAPATSAEEPAEDPGDPRGYARWGFLPSYEPGSFEIFNRTQRSLAALAIGFPGGVLPDVLVLQEVESLIALRAFNERHLGETYPHALLVDSRDFRQIDVAVLSKREIRAVRTHIDDTDPSPVIPTQPYVFSRDCLEVDIALSGRTTLTVLINHFKSKFVNPKKLRGLAGEARKAKIAVELALSAEQRLHQADRTVEIIRDRFRGSRFDQARFLVVGDLNDHPNAAPLAPLFTSGLEDALARLPAEERWTHYFKSQGTASQIDALLLSPKLSADTAGQLPTIERRGIEFREVGATSPILPKQLKIERQDDDPDPLRVDFTFDRFPGVEPGTKASDHCALFLEL